VVAWYLDRCIGGGKSLGWGRGLMMYNVDV